MKSLPNIDYKLLERTAEDAGAIRNARYWILRYLRQGLSDAYIIATLLGHGKVSADDISKLIEECKKKISTAQEKPVGKYGNIVNYLKEKGVEIDEATLDKKLRTFFEDMITEVLKNPTQWDRTRNINFMELFKYLGGQEQETPQEQPVEKQASGEVLTMGDRVRTSNGDTGEIVGSYVDSDGDNAVIVRGENDTEINCKAREVERI